MQLVFETTNNFVIELGRLHAYANLKAGSEKIKIICNKVNCFENGNLIALVNLVPAKKLGECMGNDNVKCITQAFESELLNDDSSSYEISCKYENTNVDAVYFTLYRLCKYFYDLEKN